MLWKVIGIMFMCAHLGVRQCANYNLSHSNKHVLCTELRLSCTCWMYGGGVRVVTKLRLHSLCIGQHQVPYIKFECLLKGCATLFRI